MNKIDFCYNLGDSVIVKWDDTLFLGTIIELIKNYKGEFYLVKVDGRTPIAYKSSDIIYNMSKLTKNILIDLITNGEVKIHIKL